MCFSQKLEASLPGPCPGGPTCVYSKKKNLGGAWHPGLVGCAPNNPPTPLGVLILLREVISGFLHVRLGDRPLLVKTYSIRCLDCWRRCPHKCQLMVRSRRVADRPEGVGVTESSVRPRRSKTGLQHLTPSCER